MGFTHTCMKDMIERVARNAIKLQIAFDQDPYFAEYGRYCECGADKGLEAVLAAGDGMLTLCNVKRLLGIDKSIELEDIEAVSFLMYALAKHPPEPCKPGCPHSHEWADI